MKRAFVFSLISAAVFAADPMAVSRAKITALEDQTRALSADVRCESDAECLILPMGVKECGGPRSLFIASTRNPKLAEVRTKLGEVAAMHRAHTTKFHTMSACNGPDGPTHTRCIEKQCAPVKPVPVAFRLASIPRGARTFDQTLRLESQAELEAMWSEPAPWPELDFEKNFALAATFCKPEKGALMYYDLSRIETVGHTLLVTYRKFKGCSPRDPKMCEVRVAEVPRTQGEIEISLLDVPQRCD